MKKLLFIHGAEKVKEDEDGNLYTDGSYPSNIWNRYKIISNDITVMFRKDKKIYTKSDAKIKYNILDKKISFVELEDILDSIKSYVSISKRNKNKRKIEDAVKKCDYLIARVPSACSYLAIDFAIKYHKPYIIEVVGCTWDSLWNYGIKGKILAFPSFLKQKKYVKKAENVIYVSNRFLQERYPSNGKQISCSDVILNKIDDSCLEKRLKKINSNSFNNKLVVGTLGGIDVTFKGQQYVIKAIKKLKEKGINIEYQVAGAGTGDRLLTLAKKENVEDCFKIIGSIPHEKVGEWLQNIDIYIQPSNQEGLCRSIIEAMSCACPIIASNAGGNIELIDNKYIFKKKHVNELIDKIELMFNKNEMQKEAKKNFANSKDYDIKLIDKRREDFFKDFTKL